MHTLYDFLTTLCKERDMKIEDLQKKLKVSRTTLYRYMRGINQISPELAEQFSAALNMDTQEYLVFSKLVSLSAYDQTLVESRYVIDKLMFGGAEKPADTVDIDIVFYNNDKYLRTLGEILNHIYSFGAKDLSEVNVKILNCLNENVFTHLTEFLEKAFSSGVNITVEHFIGLSEHNYLQNALSFISVFPLMKYDGYKFYFREQEIDDALMNDSVLVSVKFAENGARTGQYFSVSFYEEGMPECIAFNDTYMYNFLSKSYENLKLSFKNVIQKYNNMDVMDEILLTISEKPYYIIKPNPCYDKVPNEAFKSVTGRMGEMELINFLTSLYGQKIDSETIPYALELAFDHMAKRYVNSTVSKQIDVYSKQGLIELAETGRLTDHLKYLPPFNQEERRLILEHLRKRSDDPKDNFQLCITENALVNRNLTFLVLKDYGVAIEYSYPEDDVGLWRLLLLQSEKIASIFYDYVENHIPVNHAMGKDKADSFLWELIERL